MVIINLLPWRDELRNYQRRNVFKIILLTSLINFLILLSLHFILTRQVNQLVIANAILKTKIKKREATHPQQDQQMSRLTIPAAMIDNVVFYARATRKLLTKLGQINHDNICFSEMARHRHQLQFKGYTNSDMDLAMYLKEWRKSSLFSEIMIDKIEQQVSGAIYFQITAHEISHMHERAHQYERNSLAKDETDVNDALSI